MIRRTSSVGRERRWRVCSCGCLFLCAGEVRDVPGEVAGDVGEATDMTSVVSVSISISNELARANFQSYPILSQHPSR